MFKNIRNYLEVRGNRAKRIKQSSYKKASKEFNRKLKEIEREYNKNLEQQKKYYEEKILKLIEEISRKEKIHKQLSMSKDKQIERIMDELTEQHLLLLKDREILATKREILAEVIAENATTFAIFEEQVKYLLSVSAVANSLANKFRKNSKKFQEISQEIMKLTTSPHSSSKKLDKLRKS